MKKISKVLLVLIFLASLESKCEIGCLKCSADQVCELCDASNSYILKDNECIKKGRDDC